MFVNINLKLWRIVNFFFFFYLNRNGPHHKMKSRPPPQKAQSPFSLVPGKTKYKKDKFVHIAVLV